MPPESSRRAQAAARLRPDRGRAAGQQLPAARRARAAGGEAASALPPDPDVLVRGARAASTRKGASTASGPCESELAVAATLLRRAGAPPTSSTSRARNRRTTAEELTDEQWAAVRRRLRGADLGAHRRPRRRQDRCTRGIVAEAEAANAKIALCAPTGRAARRLRRRPDTRRRRSTACSSGCPGREPALPARASASRRPRDRRRVLDAEPAADRGAARRARRDHPRRLRRRRRPAAADRRRQALRGPDRFRRGAGRAADPDLPPGGALDDHHRRPRDQPRPAAPPRARPPTRTTTSSSSTG